MSKEVTLETLTSLAKRRGFIFQGSEIYGGLAGTWDYGPLGVELKRNVVNLWWNTFVRSRRDMYGIDAAILMNHKVWEASGHTGAGFADPMVECENCKARYRADHLIEKISEKKQEDFENRLSGILFRLKSAYEEQPAHFFQNKVEVLNKLGEAINDEAVLYEEQDNEQGFKGLLIQYVGEAVDAGAVAMKNADPEQTAYSHFNQFFRPENYFPLIERAKLFSFVKCSKCGKQQWSRIRQFNMMFKTHVGAIEDSESISYLRPETAQGMFVNFSNVLDTCRPQLPFGLGQVGKAFRNEISPRDFVFRSREFEQMEIEYFVDPEQWEEKFEEWRSDFYKWFDLVGLPKEKIHELEVPDGDRAHYSKRTIDFEFDFPFGKKELYGLAYRTDFDLKNHTLHSNEKLEYIDQVAGRRFTPHCIEPTFGLDRTIMAILSSAYSEQEVNGETRVVLKIKPEIAPVKVAILPLSKKPELSALSDKVYTQLVRSTGYNIEYDETQSIGKRYRRQDEIGTPYCVTIDFESLEDGCVTVRERDSMQQTRVKIEDLETHIKI